jgi:hypothetical protein
MDGLGEGPVAIASLVRGLVIQPRDAEGLGIPAARFRTNQIRPARRLVEDLLALDPAPLTSARTPDRRVVGTCRHFAVLACALLRHQGIPARVRCGFALYFQSGKGVDHWITEYRDGERSRWIRLDPEILGAGVMGNPEELSPEDFMTGGEAWSALRRGQIDASAFGVPGTGNWGPAEIQGNAVRDLAALNRVETLPWDEWGRMTDAYQGRTGPDYEELLDTLAIVCAADEARAVSALYSRDEFRVPRHLVR